MYKLFRPVKGERNKDWRFTQEWWVNTEKYKPLWRPYHLGLDYAGPKQGDKIPVFSAEKWVVKTTAYDKTWFGNYIVIDWDSGQTFYAHLDRVDVIEWQIINHNSQIGIMGNTGNSTGVHLHFGRKPKDITKVVHKSWWNPTPFITDREEDQFANETAILKEMWFWNGDVGDMDMRMLTVVARVFKFLIKK